MMNTTHFTNLAGNSTPWDEEMARRVKAGEDLCDLQVEFHGRGRVEAEVVKTLKGYSVRYASGLMDRGLLFKGCNTYEEAVEKGTAWVAQAPDHRGLFVRNSDMPREGTKHGPDCPCDECDDQRAALPPEMLRRR